MDLKELLRKAGFSDKEVDVYRAMLATGPATATSIADRAHVNRSTTYVILDSLTKRGLVSNTGSGAVALFDAGKPTRLVEYFKRASDHFRDLARTAESLLPSLEKQAKAHIAEPDPMYGAALSSLGKMRAAAKDGQRSSLQKRSSTKTKFAGETI